jgi:23S rRNA G2445 N2-methylase RlmL
VRALGSDAAWRVFSTYTKGPIRYRVEWADAGRRRGATWNVARALARVRPELINDPVDAPWEAVIAVRAQRERAHVMVELWPRGIDDPRFVYRQRLLPASSHPTIAAALARVGGVRDDDVVWDPFVGAGAELIERAYLGPYATLIGSDSSLVALEAAADNLRVAGIERAELRVGDARSFQASHAPSLVLTNPPFGRRVVRREEIADVLDAAVANIAAQLVPGGRFVWVSPMPRRTLDQAERGGLSVVHRFTVDMGGFDAEVQAFRKPAAKGRPAKRAKRP